MGDPFRLSIDAPRKRERREGNGGLRKGRRSLSYIKKGCAGVLPTGPPSLDKIKRYCYKFSGVKYGVRTTLLG